LELQPWESDGSGGDRAPLPRSQASPLVRAERERVARAKDGCRDALRELLVHRFDVVSERLRSRLPPAQWDVLEAYDWLSAMMEVASETVKDEELASEAALRRWLERVADHTFRLCYADVVEPRLPAPPWVWGRPEAPDAMLGDLAQDPRSRADALARCRAGDLAHGLALLTEDERVLVQVRDYVGASWEVVAAALGYGSPQQARTAHKAALRRLVELMRVKQAV
jgi:hypothetical protein